MDAADTTRRAAELFDIAKPYLLDLLKNAPPFGSAGISLIFHEGTITRVDVSASVQRKPKAGRP